MKLGRASIALGIALTMTGRIAESSPPTEAAASAHERDADASAECTSCHAEEASAWSASLHRASFRDRSFQRGYALEPQPFCRDCHAPTGDFDHGVSCASCHGSDGHDSASADHARESCIACHEFPFEGASLPPKRSELMQLTVTEHRESAFSDVACIDCHMPRDATGKRTHRFDVSRNAEFLRAAIAIVEARTTENEVVVTLAPLHVGHAFPTGDMFRRLVVIAEEVEWARTTERRLARTFGPAPDGAKKQTRTDTRLRETTTFRLPLRGAATAEVRVRVLYQRLVSVGLDLPSRQERPSEKLEDEIVLAERVLPQTATPPRVR
jgi:hypothetical protein